MLKSIPLHRKNLVAAWGAIWKRESPDHSGEEFGTQMCRPGFGDQNWAIGVGGLGAEIVGSCFISPRALLRWLKFAWQRQLASPAREGSSKGYNASICNERPDPKGWLLLSRDAPELGKCLKPLRSCSRGSDLRWVRGVPQRSDLEKKNLWL